MCRLTQRYEVASHIRNDYHMNGLLLIITLSPPKEVTPRKIMLIYGFHLCPPINIKFHQDEFKGTQTLLGTCNKMCFILYEITSILQC